MEIKGDTAFKDVVVGGEGLEAAEGAKGDFVVITRQYSVCAAVAFPSKSLEHGVTPVTLGERRSMLLITG